jgi:hypothetical protein
MNMKILFILIIKEIKFPYYIKQTWPLYFGKVAMSGSVAKVEFIV